MREACRMRPQAEAICGDANKLLPGIFERILYKEFKRALCFLDPYKILLSWDVLIAAGRMDTIEAFFHFPTGDIQRNVLRNEHAKLVPAEVERMTAMWGDESWEKIAYAEQPTLFGPVMEKQPIDKLLEAFADRLKKVAGFKHVSVPLPMRYRDGVIIYHLLFATHQPLALKIANGVLKSMAEFTRDLPVLPNVWLGASVESAAYLGRLDQLRQARAAVRFVSLEPLLGSVADIDLSSIDWAIVGGESGPGARRMDPRWVREIRAACRRQGVAFFFKQWGGRNKKRQGRTLDGKTWDEFPAAVPIAH